MLMGERFSSPLGARSAPVGATGELLGLRSLRLEEMMAKRRVLLFRSLALAACAGDPAELIYDANTFWAEK